MDDATVDALGKLSEALEVVEAARGFLYQFHRMSGMADLTLQDAVSMLRAAGHDEIADSIDRDLVGRNVVDDFWTYEIVERYDEQYWSIFRALDADARNRLADGERHGFEARMKRTEQSGRNV
jgi:hypothetical protein